MDNENNEKIMDSSSTTYVLPNYRAYFDDELATQYKPIVYSHECLSGDPKAIYYRVI